MDDDLIRIDDAEVDVADIMRQIRENIKRKKEQGIYTDEEVEELAGRKFLEGDHIVTPRRGEDVGADLYVSTSSAGGGLQMVVAGVVKTMTAESAERAALGAGAIVMDVIATNDKRRPHEQIQRIRHLRPDMVLLSGGTDGGTTSHVVEIAELIAPARPQPDQRGVDRPRVAGTPLPLRTLAVEDPGVGRSLQPAGLVPGAAPRRVAPLPAAIVISRTENKRR